MNHWDQVVLENEEREEALSECSRCDGSGIAEYEPEPGIHQEMGVSVRAKCFRCHGTGVSP